jgi:hypothetical protein
MLRIAALLLSVSLASAGSLEVRVLKEPGDEHLRKLGLEDFEVRQGGAPVAVESVEFEELPLDLMIVVERRRWAPYDHTVGELLRAMAARLERRDRVGLLAAGENVEPVLQTGTARGDLIALLEHRRVAMVDPRGPGWGGGGPALADAIVSAARSFEGDGRHYRRAIVVVSVDADDSRTNSPERALREVRAAGATLSLVSAPEDTLMADDPQRRIPGQRAGAPIPARTPAARPPPERTRYDLRDAVRQSGGEYDPGWAGGHGLRRLAERLREAYRITVDGSPDDDIEVSLTGRAARRYSKAHLVVISLEDSRIE